MNVVVFFYNMRFSLGRFYLESNKMLLPPKGYRCKPFGSVRVVGITLELKRGSKEGEDQDREVIQDAGKVI